MMPRSLQECGVRPGNSAAANAAALQQAIEYASTFFGKLGYEIVSDVDNGRITATIEVPSRAAPASMLLRLRHPQAKPMRSVMVNGKEWTAFDKEKETIELKGLTGTVTVAASY